MNLKLFVLAMVVLAGCAKTVNHAKFMNANVAGPLPKDSAMNGTNLCLAWANWYNPLQVQYATNLAGPWMVLTNIYPVWPTSIPITCTNPMEFYRLAIEPPP
jgi:hypothetical protein